MVERGRVAGVAGTREGSSPTAAGGDFRCTACGYGVCVVRELPRCPMCGARAWEPFQRPAQRRFGLRAGA